MSRRKRTDTERLDWIESRRAVIEPCKFDDSFDVHVSHEGRDILIAAHGLRYTIDAAMEEVEP